MKKPKWFFEKVYRQNFYIYLGFTRSEAEASMSKQFGMEVSLDKSSGKCLEFYRKGGGGNTICIWVDKFKRNNIHSLGILMHECIHAANYTFNARGIRYETNNDEVLCYYAQTIFENAMEMK